MRFIGLPISLYKGLSKVSANLSITLKFVLQSIVVWMLKEIMHRNYVWLGSVGVKLKLPYGFSYDGLDGFCMCIHICIFQQELLLLWTLHKKQAWQFVQFILLFLFVTTKS